MIRTEPFPHIVTDGLWDADLLTAVYDEFPEPDAPGWVGYSNDRERKMEGPPAMWGPMTRDLFDRFAGHAAQIGRSFGFDDLTMETIGGGYHLIPPGGYLGVHTDFNRSPHSGRFRVVNLLVYLNRAWRDEGGRLELWDDDGPYKSIVPEFGRTVMFATSDRSWHGHPKPARRWRRSVAAYFFSATPPDGWVADQSTVFHPGGVCARELR